MTCYLTGEPKEGYRPCVGIVLLNQDNRVFTGQRIDSRQAGWQMPQGGIDPGETPEEAGIRELKEETGTDKASLLFKSKTWRSYDLPPDIAKKKWKGRFKGQTQMWLVYRFEGLDRDINIKTKMPEFANWRWADPSGLADGIVSFKREIYLSVADEFRHLWA